MDEGNKTFTVTLSSASAGLSIGDATPTGTITDDTRSPSGPSPDASVTVTATGSNWSTGKTVTVTGVDDLIDNTPDRTTTNGHDASGGDYGSVEGTVPVTVTRRRGVVVVLHW